MVKNPSAMWETGLKPWVGKIPWRREWLPTLVFLPGEFHRERNLADDSPWGCKESVRTDQLSQGYKPITVQHARERALMKTDQITTLGQGWQGDMGADILGGINLCHKMSLVHNQCPQQPSP